MELPTRTRKIFDFLVHYQADQGAPPTVREIGEHFGIRSTNGVCYHLDLLEKEGIIRRRRGHARGIFLNPDATAAPEGLPILGRIAAGRPLLAEEHVDGFLGRERFSRGQPSFALRVTGDSMKDAGILDGDLVMVKETATPANGDIVVAMIGDETTVKRFRRQRGQVVLIPENPEYEPIVVTATSPELRILGKVVGVYRECR